MLNRRLLLILFLAFLTLANSCDRKKKVDKQLQLEELSGGDSVNVVNPEGPAQLCVLKAGDVYIGNVGQTQCVIKVGFSTKDKLAGVYYVVDSNSLYMQPKSFSVLADGSAYRWSASGGKELFFDMKYQYNSEELNGALQVNKTVKVLLQQNSLVYFSFRKYHENKKDLLTSCRYQRPVFEVDCERDVVYGHAVGPWTSLTVPDDKGYAQALLPYVFKASNQKDLDLTMDIYTPRGDSLTKRPLVVLIHGGAFFFGDKHEPEMIAQCTHLASLGYVAVSINYRMGFELTKASIQRCGVKAIQDAHAAMRFLSHFAEKYGIDKEYMYIGGSSAGSITAMSMVYMTDESRPKSTLKKHFAGKFGSLNTSGNSYTDKVKIKGLINMWGALYELDDLIAHPISIVSFHGTADKVVPCYKDYPFSQLNGKNGKGKLSGAYFDEMFGSHEIHEALKNKQVHQEFYPLEGLNHAPWKGDDRKLNEVFYFIQDKVTKFLSDDLIYDLKLKKNGVGNYQVSSSEVKSSNWELQGGIILSQSPDEVEIRLFQDAPVHKLSVSGLLNNDAAFNLQISKLVN